MQFTEEDQRNMNRFVELAKANRRINAELRLLEDSLYRKLGPALDLKKHIPWEGEVVVLDGPRQCVYLLDLEVVSTKP
jgi:hypothetical protein